MRPRGSATPSDGDDADRNGRRRQPFRPLQPLRPFHSPAQSTLKSTPPREVILTPRATPKPVKRKATSRSKRPTTKVKTENDLSRVRPPSPSEDPLLLSGTRSSPLRARFTPAFSSSPPTSTRNDPPVSFAARLSQARISGSSPVASSSPVPVHVLPTFNAPRTVDESSSAWSDSDDELNLTGEYTGKFKILKVPTKAGPPTGARADSWGRPVSPFPFSAIMERSLPLSDAAVDDACHEDVFNSMIPCDDLPDVWESATEPPPSDIEPSPPPSIADSEDEFADIVNDFLVFDVDAESTQVRPLVKPRRGDVGSDHTAMEEEEEAQIDRELSVVPDDGPLSFVKNDQLADPMEDDSSDEEDDVKGEDFIKITSEDPKAAARAAAILRMHDYDCILAAEKKRSGRSGKSTRRRRKTIENAGISKSYIDLKSQQRKTLQECETSPGSRSLPLLELWRDAEDTTFLEHHSMSYCDASFTLSPLKTTTTHPPSQLPPPGGEWNRDCWKRLDKCLVAERLAVAASRGLGTNLLADMEGISKDAVLERFVNQLGGESVLATFGPEWSRDNLILRLNVLIKKQSRRASGAPVLARKHAHDATEPRYHGLLQEAMALSPTLERRPTSTSISSDATVVSERQDTRKTVPDSALSLDTAWQTSRLRDPIRTPSRTPDPRPPHPVDQVHLRHATPLKSMIPVPIRPKRLVDLRHLSPNKADRGAWRPTARRSSGCSVKELVKQFEGLDR